MCWEMAQKCRPGGEKISNKGFLCVESQGEREIHYGRENSQ